jgi:hypothetical protein
MCVGYVSSALLARVWRILGLAVVCIRGVCVFEFDVSGACLARVCGVSGAYLLRVSSVWRVSGACLVLALMRACFLCVWRLCGACLAHGACEEGVWNVSGCKFGLTEVCLRGVCPCACFTLSVCCVSGARPALVWRVCAACVWCGLVCVSGACLAHVW